MTPEHNKTYPNCPDIILKSLKEEFNAKVYEHNTKVYEHTNSNTVNMYTYMQDAVKWYEFRQ